MTLRPEYTQGWIAWVLMFAAIEVPALIDKRPGDTLSAHLRAWFATRSKPRGWQIRRAALAGLLLWLTVHLFMEG